MASAGSSRNTGQLNNTLGLLSDTDTWLSRLYKQHHGVYRGIEAGDDDAVEAFARGHLRRSNTRICALMTSIQRQRVAAVR